MDSAYNFDVHRLQRSAVYLELYTEVVGLLQTDYVHPCRLD